MGGKENPVTQTETSSEVGAFAALTAQIDALEGGAVRAGHLDLGPDLWLSTDPGGRATLTCQPGERGISLRLEAGDSGAWAALGLRLPVEILARGRFLGLMIEATARDALSFTPTLRYVARDGGSGDVAPPEPVVLAGGTRRHLAWLPLDHDRLAASRVCELNLFFHNDAMQLEIARLEPLLIL